MRLFIILSGVLLLVLSVIGYAGQNFNLGQTDPGELYADSFASNLLLATAAAGVSTILAATRLKIVSVLMTLVFVVLLVINNPWAYKGINVGFIENPWANPGLLCLIAVSTAINAYALTLAFRPTKRNLN